MADSNNKLEELLRQGSEARHYADRKTPDGKENVEMIPLAWAIEVLKQREQSAVEKYIQPHLDYCQQQNGLSYCKNCGLSALEQGETE